MNNIYRGLRGVLGGLASTALTIGSLPAWADDDDEEIPFDEAFIFFELNDTDGDLGIHAKIDGDAWKQLTILRDWDDRRLLDIRVSSALRQQGLTELFFESAEPSFDELDPEDFFARFPEGEYEVEGLTLDDEELESKTKISHLLPAPAVLKVNGMDAAEDCDAELPVVRRGDVVEISWSTVTMSHPELGRSNEQVAVLNYE
ncbi:MAG: hypothetical protein O2907_06060, partial [Proteobacteria bacterium]|nr:hypothetical protein [Pseudomonadota bacterium]